MSPTRVGTPSASASATIIRLSPTSPIIARRRSDPAPGGIGEYHESALQLAHDVDLLIHDAHLRSEEVEAEGSFGHAAAEYAVRLGTMAGARQVALFHHRPNRTDSEVERTVCRFAESPVPVMGAAETLTVKL